MKHRMLDLFCGRFGWSKAFAARGWECVGIDLVRPPEIPENCEFVECDVLTVCVSMLQQYDFICASSPCEQFSVHGVKHFNPNPAYPELGIKLFNHTRGLCETAGIPYIMENVRAAQQFVGKAGNHCGPFYLWGNGIPPLTPQGIRKGLDTAGCLSAAGKSRAEIRAYLQANKLSGAFNSKSKERVEIRAKAATIPPELASCVADYAERLIEAKMNLSGLEGK